MLAHAFSLEILLPPPASSAPSAPSPPWLYKEQQAKKNLASDYADSTLCTGFCHVLHLEK
eukprot:18220-Hanusia_phi.AAC.1